MRDIIGTGIKKQERAVIRKTEDSRTFFFQITMMDDLSVGVFRNIYQTTLRCYPFKGQVLNGRETGGVRRKLYDPFRYG